LLAGRREIGEEGLDLGGEEGEDLLVLRLRKEGSLGLEGADLRGEGEELGLDFGAVVLGCGRWKVAYWFCVGGWWCGLLGVSEWERGFFGIHFGVRGEWNPERKRKLLLL
jgi:hypothetical protein